MRWVFFSKDADVAVTTAGSEDTSTETTPVTPVPPVVECRSDAVDIAMPTGVMK